MRLLGAESNASAQAFMSGREARANPQQKAEELMAELLGDKKIDPKLYNKLGGRCGRSAAGWQIHIKAKNYLNK